MKIVVTGGAGMIGSCIKDIIQLYPKHDFTFLTRQVLNLTDEKNVLDYFKKNTFNYIIHLAADVGGLYKNLENNIQMFENNIKMNMNILKACHINNINKGVFILSSCIYTPLPSKFPMNESMIHEGPAHPSNEGYAYAKRMLEMQCRHYNKTFNTEYICLTPVNLYGPYDNFNIKNGHFIPSIIHRFFLNKSKGTDMSAYGTGKPLRQFLYGPDFAKIICEILFKLTVNEETQSIIICNEEEYTIREVIQKITNVMKIDFNKINWDNSYSDGCMKKTVDNSKLLNIFKENNIDFEFIKLSNGLSKTYKWYNENLYNFRC